MHPEEFDRLVRQALRRIPVQFRNAMRNLEIVIEDWPDPRLMEELTGDPEAEAYGVFLGTPITEQSILDPFPSPNLIKIYQGPLQTDFPSRRELVRQIEITLVHEIAHYMGFDEETLEDYGYG